MTVALVQVCVDPRLDHAAVRAQVGQKLRRMGLAAERIYILNEIGGNIGASFGNTLSLLMKTGEAVVLCAVFHHDDCLTAAAGLRRPLAASAQEMTGVLAQQGVRCPVLTGDMRTQHSLLLWSDEPEPRYQPFRFGVYQRATRR